ncbi:hypothetical protein ACFX16_005204 [Malus domestica]
MASSTSSPMHLEIVPLNPTPIECYKLTGIVGGSEFCPPPYLLDQTGRTTGIPNPAYEAWYKKDQNFLIWLNSTLSLKKSFRLLLV